MAERKNSSQRGYGSRWQRYRITYLRAHPLCVNHAKAGAVVQATVVDHIEPHKGDHRLFWKPENHQALCAECHNSYKQRLEKSGKVAGCTLSGMPLDPSHHWNK